MTMDDLNEKQLNDESSKAKEPDEETPADASASDDTTGDRPAEASMKGGDEAIEAGDDAVEMRDDDDDVDDPDAEVREGEFTPAPRRPFVAPGSFHTGYAAIVGEPNVGKSTLLNALIGTKLSIVTSKPQTTRKSVLGIHSTDTVQVIFVDTPGVLTPHYLLQQKLAGYVEQALSDADAILLMLDAGHPDLERLATTSLGNVRELGKPIILVINKMDTLHDKKEILPVMEKFAAMGVFADIVPISAKFEQNVDVLVDMIGRYLPAGPPLYDPELISEQPQRFFVSELIREKVLELYRQEIPYSVEVAVIEYKERPAPQKIYIHAEVIVERATQKGIIIGKGGEALRKLGARARHSIEEFLDQEVYLEIFVKVREDWRSSESRLRSFGY
jgi:GTP-binding protein Era